MRPPFSVYILEIFRNLHLNMKTTRHSRKSLGRSANPKFYFNFSIYGLVGRPDFWRNFSDFFSAGVKFFRIFREKKFGFIRKNFRLIIPTKSRLKVSSGSFRKIPPKIRPAGETLYRKIEVNFGLAGRPRDFRLCRVPFIL